MQAFADIVHSGKAHYIGVSEWKVEEIRAAVVLADELNFTNVFLLLPGLPLLVILAAFLPPGTGTVVVVLIVTGWAGSARVLRAQALSIRGKDFVEAAVVTGERAPRIMLHEILPNMASILMTTFLGCVIFGVSTRAAAAVYAMQHGLATSATREFSR